MHPQEDNEPHTLCSKCKNFIRTTNYLIHEARCKGSSSNLQQSQVTSRILNNTQMRNTRSPIFPSKNQNLVQEQEKIPCHFCSYPQTLVELDTHPKVCPHRQQQCTKCKGKFPKSLMEQHMFVCPANQQQQERQRQMRREHIPMEEEEFMNPRMQPNFGVRRQGDPFSIMDMFMNSFEPPLGIQQQLQRRQQQLQRQQTQSRHVIMLGGPGGFMQLIQLLAGHRMPEHEGLSKKEINKFPVAKFKKDKNKQPTEQDEMCIICYCAFEDEQNFMQLPCKHLFHPQCIGTWLEKNPTCPVCKRNFGNHSQSLPQQRQRQRQPRRQERQQIRRVQPPPGYRREY